MFVNFQSLSVIFNRSLAKAMPQFLDNINAGPPGFCRTICFLAVFGWCFLSFSSVFRSFSGVLKGSGLVFSGVFPLNFHQDQEQKKRKKQAATLFTQRMHCHNGDVETSSSHRQIPSNNLLLGLLSLATNALVAVRAGKEHIIFLKSNLDFLEIGQPASST